ncbi:MAG TPA: SGNH/GDSL hydrolase family protein [Dermatophilaceae bacterium]|nr:SGNH/GDSL hydrolase family protein [Dermatophilaceae bacterium]
MRTWARYVAVGDSFTEGLNDVDPQDPGRYVGWADRLAAHLAEQAALAGHDFGYANLAVRGRLLEDIAGRQVLDAIALRPDLVSIVGGGNDILRPRADVDALAARLDSAVGRLREAGADVLLATPVDPRDAPLVRRTRGRVAAYTAAIWAIARRNEAYVVDQWTMVALRDWRMWADDRIHLTSEGHRRVAMNAFTTLGFTADDADWATPLPPAPRLRRVESARANAQWAREHVAPWVRRRLRGQSSGDRLEAKRPDLGPL